MIQELQKFGVILFGLFIIPLRKMHIRYNYYHNDNFEHYLI